MEYEDYILMLSGYRTKMNIESANLRRQTYMIIDVIARSNGAKSGVNINDFNRAWPLAGDVQVDIKEVLENKIKIGREIGVQISNEINLRELYKKLKSGTRGSENNNRRGRKSGNK